MASIGNGSFTINPLSTSTGQLVEYALSDGTNYVRGFSTNTTFTGLEAKTYFVDARSVGDNYYLEGSIKDFCFTTTPIDWSDFNISISINVTNGVGGGNTGRLLKADFDPLSITQTFTNSNGQLSQTIHVREFSTYPWAITSVRFSGSGFTGGILGDVVKFKDVTIEAKYKGSRVAIKNNGATEITIDNSRTATIPLW